MEEPCTCPRGPSRCTAWASHTSHRLRSDQCVSARRNVKRGIGALTPARSCSPRFDAVLVAPLLIGIAAVATVLIARTWLAETDEVVGLARGPVAVRAFVSGGSARPDKVLGSAPRLGLQVILSQGSDGVNPRAEGKPLQRRCCTHEPDPDRASSCCFGQVFHLLLLCRACHRRKMPAQLVAVGLGVVPSSGSVKEGKHLPVIAFRNMIGWWWRRRRRRRRCRRR